jgi:hypothetical protein
VIKFFWLRGSRSRQIDQILLTALRSDAYSEHSVWYWIACFEPDATSYEGLLRPGRPLTRLVEPSRLFLQDCPFASAGRLSRHFDVCATTVKAMFARNLSLPECTGRCPLHGVSDSQKIKTVEASTGLIHILNDLVTDSFDRITTGGESWFQCLYESSALLAKSPGDVVPRTKRNWCEKTRMIIVFTNQKLLIASDLPKG